MNARAADDGRITMNASNEPRDETIQRRRLYEEVERRLADEIRSGRLKAGDPVPSERDLMQRFGVGRPAIREALLSLRNKGLVRIGAGERTRVSKPTLEAIVAGVSGPVSLMLANPEGVRELQHARRFFECALVRHAALNATHAQVEALRAKLEANRAALGDPSAFERTDVEFHYELALITGNPIFQSLHQATVGWLTQQRTISLMQPGALRSAYAFHERVFAAIAARDADRAEAEMHEHLLAVERYYWKTAKAPRRGVSTNRPGTRRR
jgi:GntR family transcriptional repressor for pyruvate dehydrogenase complex